MYKTTVKEVTEKFDTEGNLTERVTRTETTEDDNVTSHTFISPEKDNARENISTNHYSIIPPWDSDSTSSAVPKGYTTIYKTSSAGGETVVAKQ